MVPNTYTHFNTIARVSQIQAPPNPVSKTADYSGERGLLESTNPLAFDSYAYSATPQYRLGFAPPLEAGPAYEMYPTGQGVGTSQDANTGKYPSAAQFPYSTPPTEYSQRHTQRMQTHVWNKHTNKKHLRGWKMVRIDFYTQSETFSPTQLYANTHTHTHTHTHCVFYLYNNMTERKKCQINKWLQQKRKSQDVTAMSGEKACKPYLFRFFPNLKKMGWCDETNSLRSLHQTQTLQSSHWTGFSVWIALAERMANRRLEGTRSHQLLGVKPSESLMRWSLHLTCLDLSHQST